MFFLTKPKVKESDLEKALKACKLADSDGYQDAQVYLQHIEDAIASSTEIINNCINDMGNYHINDQNLINKVKEQLVIVQDAFNQSCVDTKQNIERKHKQSANFNITLFGRTKAGKSTLMEILTHGDGSHMGKGGQRTTLDVRAYDWNGMSVTDVPGIDAYGGEEDEKIAQNAASFADLILFLITAGQPEGSEADWLVRLKKMDKPILCICNFKRSIEDPVRMKRFLNHPERIAQQMNIKELSEQFNKFIQENLPNEHVDFLVTHLLAKFYSQQPEYADKAQQLEHVSRFGTVEKAITQEVYCNGILYRKKSYLSIIDSPLFEQMNELFKFSADAYSQFKIVQDKQTSFDDWCKKFNEDEKANLLDTVRNQFNQLRNSVPGFVDGNLESKELTQRWKENCGRFNVDGNIGKAIKLCNDKLQSKIEETFSELQSEMKINLNLNSADSLGDYKFTNWKKVFKWTGTIVTATLGIAAIFFTGPIGWIAFGVSVLFSFFEWLSDSREDKLRERRIKLTKQLNERIDKAEAKAGKEIENLFSEESFRKGRILSIERLAMHYLSLFKGSMLSLSNSERDLALGYCDNHVQISKKIAENVLQSMGKSNSDLEKVKLVARVPGRQLVIVVDGKESFEFDKLLFQTRLGNREEIYTINFNFNNSKEASLFFLFRYFKLERPLIKTVNNGKQTVVYVRKRVFNQKEIDNLNIIQQIMKIHVIIK